jgi:ketosteroid isomerase-like protein
MRSTAAPQARRWRFTPRTGFLCRPTTNPRSAREAVRKAYDAVFAELKFDVKFTIAELVLMAPNWAYVRTNSAGVTSHASTGKTTAEANQELFILKKSEDGEWRIARYSFSPTDPPGL